MTDRSLPAEPPAPSRRADERGQLDFKWPQGVTVRMAARDIRQYDAVGNFVLDVWRLFSDAGVPCQLYADRYDDVFRAIIRPTASLFSDVQPSDVIFFHFSTVDPSLPAIARLPVRKLAYFQNITPPHFFGEIQSAVERLCREGYEQIPLLRHFDLLLANSRRTAADLQECLSRDCEPSASARPVMACPPIIGLTRRSAAPEPPPPLPAARTSMLYVGRLAPHKRVDDLFRLFAEYHRLDPSSALIVVGRPVSKTYGELLGTLVERAPEPVKRQIRLVGGVSDAQLNAVFQSASAFVTMSEHEGFCVPLVEAMQFDLPIFAFADAGVAETLDGAGHLFREKNFPRMAEEIYALLRDPARVQATIASGRRRFAEMQAMANGSTIWAALRDLVS